MANYRVTAPYVVLKLFDHTGKVQVNGLYQGAVVDSNQVDDADLKRHLDRGWVEKVQSVPAKKTTAPVKSEKPAPVAKSETESSSKK